MNKYLCTVTRAVLSFVSPLLTRALVVEATAKLLEASTLPAHTAVIALEVPFAERLFADVLKRLLPP